MQDLKVSDAKDVADPYTYEEMEQSADVEDVVDQSIFRLEYFEGVSEYGKPMLNSLRNSLSPLPRAVLNNLLENLEHHQQCLEQCWTACVHMCRTSSSR